MFENQRAEDVEAMLASNEDFSRLYQRHQELDKAVLDAELGVSAVDDHRLVEMKKEKLFAKDQLTRLWEGRSQAA